jgi:hypothetical protein
MGGEDGSTGRTELGRAALTLENPPRGTRINAGAAALGAIGLALVIGPPDSGESLRSLPFRHTRD